MPVSEISPVLDLLPSRAWIIDFRKIKYTNPKSLRPQDVEYHERSSAKEYLESLIEAHCPLREVTSKHQLVSVLRAYATQLASLARSYTNDPERMNIACANRDNAMQLVRLLDDEPARPTDV